MSPTVLIFLIVSGTFGLAYAAIIAYYTVGWYRLRTWHPVPGPARHTRCSVIVPARNESSNIRNLLDDLFGQSLAKGLYEVIIVDDHSTDDTAEIVSAFMEQHPEMKMTLLRLNAEPQTKAFKKRAIEEAVRRSSGDLLVTTDADCRMGRNWLDTLVGCYEEGGVKMLVGPVSFHNESTVFERMQTLEFLSLIAITGGAIRMHRPIMCNGANLAYGKSAFLEAGGFGTDRFSSGDDVFLMLNMRRIFGERSIRFIKSRDALVFTEAKKRLASCWSPSRFTWSTCSWQVAWSGWP